jgi:hypothetical protein
LSRCGHEMKIISLINDPNVIERILRHLGLWKQQTAPSERKTKAPEHGPVVIEDFDDGWPGYEEPVIVYHWASHWRQFPQAVTGAVCPHVCPCPRIRGHGQTRSRPLHTKKPPSRTTCPNLPLIACMMVTYRDGRCHPLSENRDKNVLDPPHLTCYAKAVRKRFLITSPHLSPCCGSWSALCHASLGSFAFGRSGSCSRAWLLVWHGVCSSLEIPEWRECNGCEAPGG